MRKIVLYIAMSLDGFICDKDGGVDWLMAFEASADAYAEFYKTVDTVVMGSVTYQQIIDELSPDAWAYKGKTSLVATRQAREDTADVTFVNDDIVKTVLALKNKPGKDIWLVGGAKLVSTFMAAQAIDEYIISVAPVVLGSGTPLFLPGQAAQNLMLTAAKQVGGFAELTYTRSK